MSTVVELEKGREKCGTAQMKRGDLGGIPLGSLLGCCIDQVPRKEFQRPSNSDRRALGQFAYFLI